MATDAEARHRLNRAARHMREAATSLQGAIHLLPPGPEPLCELLKMAENIISRTLEAIQPSESARTPDADA